MSLQLIRNHSAFPRRLGEVRTFSQERRQITVRRRRVIDARQIGGRLQSRKDGVGNFAMWHFFFAVARGNVARPVPNIFNAGAILRSQKNDGAPAFAATDTFRPEDFHEIARLRFREAIEIAAEAEFMKKAGCPRAVCIPAAPNSFAIVLISNDQLIERGEVELKLSAFAQGLDCANENEVSSAGAKARKRCLGNGEDFSRFKMRSRLQSDLGIMRGGVFPAAGHFPDLLEDQIIEVFSCCWNCRPGCNHARADDCDPLEHRQN